MPQSPLNYLYQIKEGGTCETIRFEFINTWFMQFDLC